jgi:Mg2+ and Co2+ transporter CorA
MIILTYISGLMTALLAGLLFFAVRAYRKYTLLLRAHDISTELYAEIHDDFCDWMDETNEDLDYIRDNMEQDSYESITELNGKFKELKENQLRQIHDVNNLRDTSDKLYESLFKDIEVIKRNLRALGSDPNTISRY